MGRGVAWVGMTWWIVCFLIGGREEGKSLRKGFLSRMNWASLVPMGGAVGLSAGFLGASAGVGGGFFRAAVAASIFAVCSLTNLSRSGGEPCGTGLEGSLLLVVMGIVAEPVRPKLVGCILSGWRGPVSEYGMNLGLESLLC